MEYTYDGASENAKRLPLLIMAVSGCVLSVMGGSILIAGVRIVNGQTATVLMAMLLSGPVLLSIYLSNLLRHYHYKTARIVLEGDEVVIHRGGQEQRILRSDIDYVSHQGSYIEIRLRRAEPVLLYAVFNNQADLLQRLGCSD